MYEIKFVSILDKVNTEQTPPWLKTKYSSLDDKIML